ncbi:MAG: bifunctional transaldolase/phosoglucose isomerase [Acidobacteriota bacterium]
MRGNPLLQLQEQGQSVWVDYLRRRFITSGELERLIGEDGVRGETSNPSIFAKAISGSNDYDEALASMVGEGMGIEEVYETLAVEDIRMAAERFLPVYEATDGVDGFVSIEVSPHLAHDAEGTVEECHRLLSRIDRANVLIKIPGTVSGIAAVEAMIAEGQNVNVTLLFSLAGYRKVAAAYLNGLERYAASGGDLAEVHSVASFFLSRIDVLVDDLLGDRIRTGGGDTSRAESLLGSIAIANAKLAYQAYKQIFSGDRWQKLASQGARVQRLLWASTSSKNPLYRDVRYVEELIGSDTVNTMPLSTINAFRSHGEVRATLEEDVEGAKELLVDLAEVGIDFNQVTSQLQDEGVQKFIDPFDQLMAAIARERERILEQGVRSQVLVLAKNASSEVAATAEALDDQKFVRRLWAKDALLWSKDEKVQETIRDRLGWLDVVEAMLEECQPACRFGAMLQKTDVEQVVLLGMGGSSLCPEVCRRVFGVRGFTVLDSTVPAAVRAVAESLDPARTLVLVSSKSGTTTETRALADYFFARATPMLARPGERFVAVTDPGTPLEQLAHERGFRRLWLNPPDIGGRYSALSYFGLVPMAVMGLDVERLLDGAYRMVQSCAPEVPAADNPGVSLGLALYQSYKEGRDKVTFVTSARLAAFGEWVEQLIAESTGKQARGLVPVHGEPLGEADAYGDDRQFVYLRFADDEDPMAAGRLEELAAAGHPLVQLTLADPYDLGEEFFRWEVAVAVAGALMGINPFDEPNVQESKDRTAELLEVTRRSGALPELEPALLQDGVALYADLDRDIQLAERLDSGADLAGWLRAHLGRASVPAYLAIQAFLAPDDRTEETLRQARWQIRDARGIATTFGWGPRFLHSTGQLHKGGSDYGLFLQLTADDARDLDCPGRSYSFGTLARAQAMGDLQALQDRDRKVLRVHLGADVQGGLHVLMNALGEALEGCAGMGRPACAPAEGG